MLPFKKIFTSKSVCLVLIFLSSTTFGFLERDFRDSMPRKSVRGSRNKEYLEDLPFQRDISRQANEKDRVYENVYDRRSFRTGTDRQIRIEDKERFPNTRERHSEGRDSIERSVRLYRDAKDTKLSSYNRERFYQERSRTLRNDRLDSTRSSRVSRDDRERNHNQRTPSESQERLFVRNNRARQISEQDLENRIQNEPVQNNRAWQIRKPLTDIRIASERILENQEPFLDYTARQIRERSFENGNRFRQIRISNRIQRLAHIENNRARQIHEQLTDNRISNERSLENEPFPDRRVRQIRNTENRVQRERNLEDRKLLVSNRIQREHNFANVGRLAKARQSREQPLADRRINNIQHQRERTYNIERESRIQEEFRERNVENRSSFRNDRHFRQMPERENILVQDVTTLETTRAPLLSNQRYVTDNRHNSEQPFVSRYQNEKERLSSLRYTRRIRQYRQHSLENRDQFLDRRVFRDAEQSIINRERSAKNVIRFARDLHDNKIRNTRSVENRERRSIQIRDVRQREQNMYDRERRLNTRERSQVLRERSIDLQENKIRNIGQFGDRGSRLYDARATDNSNQRITTERYSRTSPESRRISTFSARNERSSTENRTVKAVKIRSSERDISRKDLSRATLSRSDSARQIRDARINLKESAIRKMPSNSQTRDEVKTLRSTRADRNLEERRMVPIVEYTPFNRRSFERVDQIRNMSIREKSLKFEAFANVIQVILGVYLIGQIFARSSKKTLIGFEGILPSMAFAKQKVE